jgi:hypothetical protein
MTRCIYFFIVLSCTVFSLASCKDEEDFSDNVEFKPMLFRSDSSYYTCIKYVPELSHSVTIKGNAYVNLHDIGYGLALYNYTDTVNWRNEEDWAFLNENMGASYCKLKLGKISLGGNSVIFQDCIQGTCSLSKWTHDIPLAAYDEDPDKSSWLEITRIDSIEKIVEGKFEFHFVFDYAHDASASAFARKISYRDGKFRAKANF